MIEILTSPVVLISALVWMINDCLKFTLAHLRRRPIRYGDPGGMPSGHAAIMAGAATTIGLNSGFDSDLFGLAVVVSAIVMHDAFRVRWAVGQTAERLNELLKQSKSKVKPTVVWKGHRIREVTIGALLGIGLALAFYRLLYGG